MMITLSGQAVTGRVAVGPVHVLSRGLALEDVAAAPGEPAAELKRLEAALEQASAELEDLANQAREKAGDEGALLFEVHAMLLEDDDFLDAVKDRIRDDQVCAPYAVAQAGIELSEAFRAMKTEYMRQRAADMRDVSSLLVRCLTGAPMAIQEPDEPYILAAEDLAPSETMRLNRSLLLGFLTASGSLQSHTAILARSMDLPALVGVGEVDPAWEGRTAVLDGQTGTAYIDPDEALVKTATAHQERQRSDRERLQELIGKENVTIDGRRVEVFANIGGPQDMEAVQANDAGGIGLFRSEFLYLEAKDFPSEEEQFAAYKRVVEAMEGKKVVIRTLDIGADKQVGYFGLDREENPALGYRAIRICLTRPEIFKRQLRAILRASAFGTVSIMFPMIISLEEVRRAKAVLAECRTELEQEGVPIGSTEVGIMVETPAAAILADELAEEVDFFSIGTNDLTQYTLAIDRQNPKLAPFYDPHHPAILRMIQGTVEAGHRHGCWVGICGELGADLSLTETFLRMGVDELSVAPAAILPLRDQIRKLDLRD